MCGSVCAACGQDSTVCHHWVVSAILCVLVSLSRGLWPLGGLKTWYDQALYAFPGRAILKINFCWGFFCKATACQGRLTPYNTPIRLPVTQGHLLAGGSKTLFLFGAEKTQSLIYLRKQQFSSSRKCAQKSQIEINFGRKDNREDPLECISEVESGSLNTLLYIFSSETLCIQHINT